MDELVFSTCCLFAILFVLSPLLAYSLQYRMKAMDLGEQMQCL